MTVKKLGLAALALCACGTSPDMTDAAVDAGSDVDASFDTSADVVHVDAGTTTVRLLAGNLTSGSSQNYDSGEGMRIFQGLHPDVAMIQEFNYLTSGATDIRAFVDAAFGTEFLVMRGGGNQIPNGVISRFPMIASGDWVDPQVANRDFVWAQIDVPGPRDLWAISVHLLTTGGTERNAEAVALVGFIQANVPPNDYVVIAGDFNTAARNEPCIATFAQAMATAAPYPADQANNDNTNSPRNAPHDWVLASPSLDPLHVPIVIGANAFANGLVFDSRVYTPITDVPPILATDSAATNMQHMAVVRDFALPL